MPLVLVWEDFRDDPALRFAILSGNGRCFGAGADLSSGAPKSRYEYTGVFPDITHTRGVYKPIIAAMHKLEFPALKQVVRVLAAQHRPDAILMEAVYRGCRWFKTSTGSQRSRSFRLGRRRTK